MRWRLLEALERAPGELWDAIQGTTRSRRRPDGARPQARLPYAVAAGLAVSVLLLALTGSGLFLATALVLALMLWALEESRLRGPSGRGATLAAPAPAELALGPLIEPELERPVSTEPRHARSRSQQRKLNYEAMLAELLGLVGSQVTVVVAASPQSPTAARLSGVLEPGSLDDAADAARAGRGLFFRVGSDAGFFLPAIDFVAAKQWPGEISVQLRGYTLAIKSAATQCDFLNTVETAPATIR